MSLTKDEIIKILLKNAADLTDEEVSLFIDNRDEFSNVKNSSEYWKAYRKSIQSDPSRLQVDGVEDHEYVNGSLVKTVCVTAVIGFFGIDPSSYRRALGGDDVARILRSHRYSVRSRKSTLKRDTLDQTQKMIAASGSAEGQYFYVSVRLSSGENHAMLLDHSGAVLVDTAPATPMWSRTVFDVKIIERA